MTRTMGDAIHANVPQLAAAAGIEMVAGYVTGSPEIAWTAADWALFPDVPHVTIDQGYTGSPVPTAVVRDVESGAWSAGSAVGSRPWTAARPTIYCNQSTLPSVLAAGWRGDLWLAIVGWQAGESLPDAPGCTIVAVQDALSVNGAYDLSTVLDPYWPAEGPDMNLVLGNVPGTWAAAPTIITSVDGTVIGIIGLGTDGNIWTTKQADGVWSDPVPL
jgi:hypothetical protein